MEARDRFGTGYYCVILDSSLYKKRFTQEILVLLARNRIYVSSGFKRELAFTKNRLTGDELANYYYNLTWLSKFEVQELSHAGNDRNDLTVGNDTWQLVVSISRQARESLLVTADEALISKIAENKISVSVYDMMNDRLTPRIVKSGSEAPGPGKYDQSLKNLLNGLQGE